MARVLSKEEYLAALKNQYANLGAQIAELEGKPAPIRLHSKTPNQIVNEANTFAEDLSKLSSLDRVLKKHPDLEGFRKELSALNLKTDAEILTAVKKLDEAAIAKSAEASAKRQPAAPVLEVKAVVSSAPAAAATPLSPLEAALSKRPDLAGFKKELEAESKKPGVTGAQLIALGNKLDAAKISGK